MTYDEHTVNRETIEDALRADLASTVNEFVEYLGTDTLYRLAVAYAQRGNAGVVDEFAHAYDAAIEAYAGDIWGSDQENYEDDRIERGRDVRREMVA